jgi:hypothetical protein
MKICPKCQAECADDAGFCNKCGFNFSEIQAPAETPAFCQKCGKPLDPGVTFCPGCGAKIGGGASAGNPFADFGNQFKTLFTKGPQAAVNEAGKSKGLGWIFLCAAVIVTFMFAVALNIHQFFYFGANRAAGVNIFKLANTSVNEGFGYSFGLGVLFGFLCAAIAFFGISFAIFAVAKFILKKNVGFMNVLNMVGMAALPVACVSLLNLVIGLIWAPLTVITMGVALVFSFVLMYNGALQLVEYDAKAPVLFALAFAAFAAVFFIALSLIVGIAASDFFFKNLKTAAQRLT